MSDLFNTADGITEKKKKIGYEQLKDCTSIIRNRGELISTEGKEILKELDKLVGVARFQNYCDFTYELLQVLEGKNSLEAKLCRDKYFPVPKYDPSREG